MAKADAFPTTSTPVALPEDERRSIEAEIQEHLDAAHSLIGKLDAADGDCEDEGAEHDGREPETDEPDLGWPEMGNQSLAIKACTSWEAQCDLERDTADHEPSLGAPLAAMHDQTRWFAGDTSDLEEQCEDEGACETAGAVL